MYGTQFLGNCVPAKSRSVPPALAGADGSIVEFATWFKLAAVH